MFGFRRKRLDSAALERISSFIERTFVDVEEPADPAAAPAAREARPVLLEDSACYDAFGSAPAASMPAAAAPSMPAPAGASAPAARARALSARAKTSASQPSLAAWLDRLDEPFSTTLLALIDRKGMSDVQVYKRAHMSRQLFSRIRSDADYRPAKKTVLALAIALELTLDETRSLLERAGFALSHANKRDVIVEYFIANGIFDVFAVNEALYEFDQPIL